MAEVHTLLTLAARLRENAGETKIAAYAATMLRAAMQLEAMAMQDFIQAEIRRARDSGTASRAILRRATPLS